MSEQLDGTEVLRRSYMKEIYESFFKQFRVTARVTSACQLDVMLRGSRTEKRSFPFIGGECFTPIGVWENASKRQLMRLTSNEVSEYVYAEAPLPMLSFEFEYHTRLDPQEVAMGKPTNRVLAGDWDSLVLHMLAARTVLPPRTNQQVLDGVLEAERQRQFKEGMASHDAFGTWG